MSVRTSNLLPGLADCGPLLTVRSTSYATCQTRVFLHLTSTQTSAIPTRCTAIPRLSRIRLCVDDSFEARRKREFGRVAYLQGTLIFAVECSGVRVIVSPISMKHITDEWPDDYVVIWQLGHCCICLVTQDTPSTTLRPQP